MSKNKKTATVVEVDRKKAKREAGPVAPSLRPKKAKAKAVETPADAPAPTPAPAPQNGSMTLAGLILSYGQQMQDDGKTLGTVASYLQDLDLAARFFRPDALIRSIDAADYARWLESDLVTKTDKGRAKAKPTIDKTRRAFRHALLWAKSRGNLDAVPFEEKAHA